MSTKKRPGVQAGIDLAAQPKNVKMWLDAERKLKDLPMPNLHKLEKELALLSKKETMTKEDLDTIVSWKFVVGKSRPSIRKLLQSNSDEQVAQHTQQAIRMAKKAKQDNEDEINDALAELEQLKGIGPATASAVLSLVNPSVFSFMYDEVIDCFMPKRDYKRSTYLCVRKECQRISISLNKASSSSSWTPARVATVLWTACRDFAIHGATMKRDSDGSDCGTNRSDGGHKRPYDESHPEVKRNSYKFRYSA